MDICSPYVVIRLLATVGAMLFGLGLWLAARSQAREELVQEYNVVVDEWSRVHLAEFQRVEFKMQLGMVGPNRTTHEYPLLADEGVTDRNMIPAGFYDDLRPYSPLQFLGPRQGISAAQVVTGGSPRHSPPLTLQQKVRSEINVTLVAITHNHGGASSSSGPPPRTQVLHVGTFQMLREWRADAHVCDGFGVRNQGQSTAADGSCQVLRAVRNMCLVVSWNGPSGWKWRRPDKGGRGCDANKPTEGVANWYLAETLDEMTKDAQDFGERPVTLQDLEAGRFNLVAGVFDEHDPYLTFFGDDDDSKLDVLMSNPLLESLACLVCGSVLVTIFVVHWTVCEKMSDGELDRELTRLLIATGAAPAPPSPQEADRIFRRRRERERRRAEALERRRAEAAAAEEARAALLDSPPRAAQADQLQLQSDAILQAGDHGPPGAEPEPEPEPV